MIKKNHWVYLTHMWAMCQKALNIVNGLEESEFLQDEILQLALTRLIEVIGEAAAHVDDVVRAEFDAIPWYEIIGMRHRIVHDYLNVDEQIIWQVANEDLPSLFEVLDRIIPEEYKREVD
jgi:uncharacterized protein with HEPN domain